MRKAELKKLMQELMMGDFPLDESVKEKLNQFVHSPAVAAYYSHLQLTKGFEDDYSFLHVARSAKLGTYCITTKDGFGIGEITEPNRQCDEWQYSFTFKDHTTSGTAPTFDMAKKSIFDFIYSHVAPEEYLKMMDI